MVTKVKHTVTYVTALGVYQFIDLISTLNLEEDAPSSSGPQTPHVDCHDFAFG